MAISSLIYGYTSALREFAKDDREHSWQFRIDSSPRMIRKLLRKSQVSRKKFLSNYIDPKKSTFLSCEEIVPRSSRTKAFQGVVDAYQKNLDAAGQPRPSTFFRVLDVALKKGSGTASLGLDRYLVLLEGWGQKRDDRVLLEMKRARRSALSGLFSDDKEINNAGEAQRLVAAKQVREAGGDPLFGVAKVHEQPFLVKECSRFDRKLDIDALSAGGWKNYAQICGEALAQTHARADEREHDHMAPIELDVLRQIRPKVLCSDVWAFAKNCSRRVESDFNIFRDDHAAGAFEMFG